MDKEEKYKLGKLEIGILFLALIIIIFSFVAPILFVQESIWGIDFTETGPIGDTIGGIMNPFIALVGVLLTFLAFYIQYRANKLQRELFRFELDAQKLQFNRTQFENQFYEMLKMHKANVNDIEVIQLVIKQSSTGSEFVESPIRGMKAFNILLSEFDICYHMAKISFSDDDYNVWVNEAYAAFFHGVTKAERNNHDFFDSLLKLSDAHKGKMYTQLDIALQKIYLGKDESIAHSPKYPLFKGHSSQLAHYYRHLFQTVKFVANQSDDLLSYEEKRRYLRILRAQLSNQEQTMLFYNWLSQYGRQWEGQDNKFFTDYRMIHNIYQNLLFADIELSEIFNLNSGFRKESNRVRDSLFEFQDWG